MAAKETTLNELGEMMSHVVEHMATKEDIAAVRAEMATKEDIANFATKDEVRTIVREELKHISSELTAIRRDLDDLQGKFDNVSGFQKEIDYALERVAAIERHLGIKHPAH